MHVRLSDFFLTFSDQVDNPLMGLEVLAPNRNILAARQYSDAHKGKHGQQELPGMVENIRIVRKPAEFE